ncbi:MAG: septum formation initiator family protein [Eubacteriales bacterium]|nr:septum formation initiator family protein [Eubacteriales bacterium]
MSKRKKPVLGLVIVLALSVYFVVTLIKQQGILNARRSELEALELKVARESMTNEELKEAFNILGSNEYIEKVAREKLGMLKVEEKVFVDINK